MLKEVRTEEHVKRKGDKFVYSSHREVEMDREDLLASYDKAVAERDSFVGQKALCEKMIPLKQKYIDQIKPLAEKAKEEEGKRFCEVCGMDLEDPVNKGMRLKDLAMCKNCAKGLSK